MTYRCFAEADEKIAEGWSAQPEAIDQWTLGDAIGRGEAGSFYAASDKNCRAACKPAFDGRGTPRAAHEKIASDIARALGLPAPAVCLWTDRTTGARYAMSAWAFAQALTWGEIATRLSPEFMRNAAATFSAARVFHSWIGDTDHFGNAGNVVVNVESSETRPGVAFIDHAFSMSHNPGFVTLPVGGAPPISYITADLLDVSAAHGMVAAVNDLGPNFLEDTVRRIPAPFLPPDHGKDIIEGLLRRRGELAAVFGVAPV